MTAPDLLPEVKAMLASEEVRTHHHLWHFVRNRAAWNSRPQAEREALIAAGWQAPRFENEPGAGLDFLRMHREMIAMVDAALANAGDPFWRAVRGWAPIPWADDDPLWPVPDWPTPDRGGRWARDPAAIQQMKTLVAEQFRNPAWLQTVTLDQLGRAMEGTIHAWMHLRWSGPPPADLQSADPANDWLAIPYASHVNKHFWKLHGWIDERIADWEAANGQTADLSTGWSGPTVETMPMAHAAPAHLMANVPPVAEMPIPMMPVEGLIEGVIGDGPPPWELAPEVIGP